VTGDGVKLYCRTVGEGEQTLIVPLATYHADRFDPLARGRRVVVYDPRGRGRSDAVGTSAVSLENQLRDLEAVREGVGAEKVALVGWSSMVRFQVSRTSFAPRATGPSSATPLAVHGPDHRGP
jgi:pimeloyl-ACP methyl ester carboxylesterase